MKTAYRDPMNKVALGFSLSLITVVAFFYGYDFSMTIEGFPIKGYVGAFIPASLVLLGAAIGGAIASWTYGLNEERLEELNADSNEDHTYACFCCGLPNKLTLEERAQRDGLRRVRGRAVMKILHSSWSEHVEQYGLLFKDACFDCDRNGRVDVTALNATALANYEEHIARGEVPEVADFSRHIRHCAIGECAGCGREVALQGFTNSCACGRDYNSAGQLLAPRSQWGEETGEHPADIARIR